MNLQYAFCNEFFKLHDEPPFFHLQEKTELIVGFASNRKESFGDNMELRGLGIDPCLPRLRFFGEQSLKDGYKIVSRFYLKISLYIKAILPIKYKEEIIKELHLYLN